MTENTSGDTPTDNGTDPTEDARVTALQGAVDRVVSWQEAAEPDTVRAELDEAISKAGVDVEDSVREQIVERITADDHAEHFDVREFLSGK